MAHPKPSDWGRVDDIVKASTRGYNALEALPRNLQKQYPWLRDFNFGFYTENDLPSRMMMGWRYLMVSDFAIESFNEAIGLKHGLSDAGGHVKQGNNYVMIIPKDIREKQRAARNKQTEDAISDIGRADRYVSPDDPRADEMLEAEGLRAELSMNTVAPTSAKKRPGRPRKK